MKVATAASYIDVNVSNLGLRNPRGGASPSPILAESRLHKGVVTFSFGF